MVKLPKMYFMFKTEGNVHQIYIYDDVKESGSFNWNTWQYDESKTSAKYFQKMLEEIPEEGTIELYINSNGGSYKEGTAIFNQLARHKAKKVGYVDGVCHSIAFTILQACDERIMGEGTCALIHNPWVATAGNAEQLIQEAEKLKAMEDSCRCLLMKRAKNITEEEVKEMMQKETMLSPEMALQYGFIDRIEERGLQESGETMQAAGSLKEIRDSLMNKEFQKELEEFQNYTNHREPEENVSMMDAFFNIFS